MPLPIPSAHHAVAAFHAEVLRVVSGANAGDPLPLPEHSVCGDYYRLDEAGLPITLALDLAPNPAGSAGALANGSQVGRAGAEVALRGRLSLMAPDGDLAEVLVLEIAGTGRFALPLTPLRPSGGSAPRSRGARRCWRRRRRRRRRRRSIRRAPLRTARLTRWPCGGAVSVRRRVAHVHRHDCGGTTNAASKRRPTSNKMGKLLALHTRYTEW